jgi:hypothetical protein
MKWNPIAFFLAVPQFIGGLVYIKTAYSSLTLPASAFAVDHRLAILILFIPFLVTFGVGTFIIIWLHKTKQEKKV